MLRRYRHRRGVQRLLDGSSGGVALPTPPVAGPEFWYRADLGLTVGDVETWPDQSGNARDLTQSDSAQRPSYSTSSFNSSHGVTFDGVDEILAVTGYNGAIDADDAPWTAVLALKWEAVAADKGGFAFGNSASNSYFHQYRSDGALGNAHAVRRRGSPGDDQANGTATLLDTAPHILSIVFTGTAVSLYQDGTVDAMIDGAAQDVGTFDIDNLALGGKLGTAEGDYGNLTIAEFICYASALSAGDRGTVEAALTTRWGL